MFAVCWSMFLSLLSNCSACCWSGLVFTPSFRYLLRSSMIFAAAELSGRAEWVVAKRQLTSL